MDDDNPYAPPASTFLPPESGLANPDEAFRDGKLLVVRKGAALPDRCVKCNEPAGGYRFHRALSWHRPAWFILLVSSLLLYILIYFFVRSQGEVTVGLCLRHRRKRTRAIVIGWLVFLAGLATAFAAAAVSGNASVILVVVGIVTLLAGIIGGMIGSRVLVPKRIGRNFIWLKSLSPDYLATFPDWVSR